MSTRNRRMASRSRMAGLSLVELMIALVLGLLVVSGALAIFISNRQTYRATEQLGRVQENSRVAFELMARDIREAGGNPCGQDLPTVNVVNNTSANWWSNFAGGITGYDGATAAPGLTTGTGTAQRVAGTSAIDVQSGDNGVVTVTDHNPTSAQFKVNTVDHGINDGDIILVCDGDHASITQVTNASPSVNDTIVHNTGTGSPGNCTKGLGIPDQLGDPGYPPTTVNSDPLVYTPGVCITNGKPYTYGPNSKIAKFSSHRWYIGNNARGGRSLYEMVLGSNGSGTAQVNTQEVADGVRDLQVTYLQSGSGAYVAAAAITNWAQVRAARLVLTLESTEQVGTDAAGTNQTLQRTLDTVVTLRNHSP